MNELYLVKAGEVASILEGKEQKIMEIVADTYVAHTSGKSSLPHSVFLRFPDNELNRIIGLPAYLGGDVNAAGIKWISSYPDNIKNGIERASALLILNNTENGHAEAIIESSIISAKRTAASAALGAKLLHSNANETTIGFVGCGRINREICKFLKLTFLNVKKIVAYDLSTERAQAFLADVNDMDLEIKNATSVEEVLSEAPLVSFATTVGVPYVNHINACSKESTILNISLRDFAPEVILSADNIVDDLDHVCRERTSIHLAEGVKGDRSFVRCPIADIIRGKQAGRAGDKVVIYSPFGLGVLDIALAQYVREVARKSGMGTVIPDFLP